MILFLWIPRSNPNPRHMTPEITLQFIGSQSVQVQQFFVHHPLT